VRFVLISILVLSNLTLNNEKAFADVEILSPQLTPKLERIYQLLLNNEGKIQNWSGNVDLTIKNYKDNELVEDQTISISFSQDFIRGNYINTYNVKNSQIKNVTVSPFLDKGGFLSINGICYDYFSLIPQKKDGSKINLSDLDSNPFRGLLVIKKSGYIPLTTESLGTRYLTASLLKLQGLDHKIRLKGYLDFIRKGNSHESTIYHEKDGLAYITDICDGIKLVQIFDLSKSAILIQIDITSKEGSDLWKCEPQNVDGVWVPSKIISENIYADKKNKGITVTSWNNIKINEDNVESNFTLLNLGVRQEDHVSDLMKQSGYRIHDESLPKEIDISELIKRTKYQRTRLILILLGITLILTAIIKKYLDYKHRLI
jgi:hypothetical protein